MNQAYVRPLILASLVAPGVGDVGASSVAGQARSGEALGASARLRQRQGHLHEDQLREPGSRSRVDRSTDESGYRRHDATLQRQFVALGERAESRHWQVRLGTRVGCFLGFGVRHCGSLRLHRESGRTSSEEGFCRGTEAVRRALRAGVAEGQGMKLLKQLHSATAPCTWLKPGVNETAINEASCESHKSDLDLINTRLQSGVRSASVQLVSLTPGFSRVQRAACDGNRFNGFPD
jgi:hypothetical protein